MPWTKQEPWTGPVHIGCLNCSVMRENAYLCQLTRTLAVGFGETTVKKDAEVVYLESDWEYEHGYREPLGMTDEELEADAEGRTEEDDYPTLAVYEAQAAADPDHDWRVIFWRPLHEEEYQRQGPEAWVLIRSGEGFA